MALESVDIPRGDHRGIWRVQFGYGLAVVKLVKVILQNDYCPGGPRRYLLSLWP